VAREGDTKPAGRAKGRRPEKPTLRLLRTEPVGRDGIMIVYEDLAGGEQSWLMKNTTVQEFLALLLHGNMRGSRRIVAEAEVAVEPPETRGGNPMLCFASGPLVTCVPMDVVALRGLRNEIDRALKPRA
jgi:hypothetical protein